MLIEKVDVRLVNLYDSHRSFQFLDATEPHLNVIARLLDSLLRRVILTAELVQRIQNAALEPQCAIEQRLFSEKPAMFTHARHGKLPHSHAPAAERRGP